MRKLSHGDHLSVVVCAEPAETVLLSRLLSAVRTRKWNIDVIAQSVANRDSTGSASSSSSQPAVGSANEAMQPLVDLLISQMQIHAESATISDQDKRIQALQAQLDKYQQIPVSPKKPWNEEDGPAESGAFKPTGHALKDLPSLSSCGDKAVKAWIEKVKTTLTKAKAEKVDEYLGMVFKEYQKLPRKEKPVLSDLAISWGLPGALSKKANDASLCKVIAMAALCAS